MSTDRILQQLDRLYRLVEQHNSILLTDLETDLPHHENTISNLRQQFEAHIGFLLLNLESYKLFSNLSPALFNNTLHTSSSRHTSCPALLQSLQDITTVENDLKRPLAHFEDFLDHVTDHFNNYESLRSFNRRVSNITKVQTFKESIKRWPQFDTTLIATWEIDNNNVLTRSFAHFTDYLINQYGNLPTDVKPRGGNAYNVWQSGKGKGKPKGKGKAKENPTKGKTADWVASSIIGTPKISRHTNANAPSTTVANVPSSKHGGHTATDCHQREPTSPRHPRPTSLLHYFRGCPNLYLLNLRVPNTMSSPSTAGQPISLCDNEIPTYYYTIPRTPTQPLS
jgi:hypothetical protein